MTAFEETPEYRFGRKGELTVISAFRARGHLVIDTSRLEPENGHGPRVLGTDLVPADADVTLVPWQVRILLQIKAKSHPDMGRITQKPEHGIPWADWKRYQQLERSMGDPVFLVIWEADSGLILGQRIRQLTPRGDCPTRNGGQPMAYFTREQFPADFLGRCERYAERVTGPGRMRRRGLKKRPAPDVGLFDE